MFQSVNMSLSCFGRRGVCSLGLGAPYQTHKMTDIHKTNHTFKQSQNTTITEYNHNDIFKQSQNTTISDLSLMIGMLLIC